jgi:hypothetical protein
MQLNALRRTAPALLALRYSEMAADSAQPLPPESTLGFSAMIEMMLNLEEEQIRRRREEAAAAVQ